MKLLESVISIGVGVGVGKGDGVGSVVGVGIGCGVAVSEGAGDGVGDGIGAREACFFQVNFLPCLVQMKLAPFDVLTCPAFVHFAPALTAAFASIAGIETREIERSAMRSFWGVRTVEVSQGKHGETITFGSQVVGN